MSSKSDIEHWQINATIFSDRVEETHYVSDLSRNIRRQLETSVWQIEENLGRGGFGEVRLERNKDNGKLRAVKKIYINNTRNTNPNNGDYDKELRALLEFSKPKVYRIKTKIYL